MQRRRDERETQQRDEREKDEARKAELHSPQTRQWQKKDQELRGLKMKCTQRVEERPPHLKHTPGARKDIHLFTESDEEGIVGFVKDHVGALQQEQQTF